VTEERNGKGDKPISVKVTKKVEKNVSVKEGKSALEKMLPERMEHEGRIIHQMKEWKYPQETLTKNDLLLIIDWSENWESKCEAEIQSMHFGGSRQQFSLHTGFAQTSDRTETFCTASDVIRHDPSAIYAHLKPILDRYITPEIENLHVKSDGPITQYRSRKMFYIVSQYITRKYPQLKRVYWNFTEAGHGKDIPDGVGGTMKGIADRAVAHGTDIQTLDQFVEALCQKGLKTHVRGVSKIEIDQADKDLIIPEFKSFVGTMKIHQYTWVVTRPTQIVCKTLSCYQCPRDLMCNHFVLGLPYEMAKPALAVRSVGVGNVSQTSKKKGNKSFKGNERKSRQPRRRKINHVRIVIVPNFR